MGAHHSAHTLSDTHNHMMTSFIPCLFIHNLRRCFFNDSVCHKSTETDLKMLFCIDNPERSAVFYVRQHTGDRSGEGWSHNSDLLDWDFFKGYEILITSLMKPDVYIR